MKPAEPAPARIAFGETSPDRPILRFSHAAMATVFEVHCVHDDAAYSSQAAHAAFALVDRLEQELSRFIANSDISRINTLRAGEGTRVSPSTLECLEIAQRLFDLTGGAFDVSIGTRLDRLELVPDDFTVVARADGIRLDLGGIGKGYAVDQMAELLDEWEIQHALVHGGFSSVRALDPPPDRDGWPLTLSAPGPGDQKILATIEAHQMALSASGTRKGGHIVGPSTGRAAPNRAVWTALTMAARPEEPALTSVELTKEKPAAIAECLSTAFMLLPVQQIEALCQQWPEIEAWLVPDPAEGEAPEADVLHWPRSEDPRSRGRSWG